MSESTNTTSEIDYSNFKVPNDTNKELVKQRLQESYGDPADYKDGTWVYNPGKSARNMVIVQDVYPFNPSAPSAYTVVSGELISEKLQKELFKIAMKGLEKDVQTS